MDLVDWYCPLCYAEGEGKDVTHCPLDGTPILSIEEHNRRWIGQILDDKYRVVRFLGAGGMADVFEVEHTTSNKKLALKLLKPEFTGDALLMERFRQEAWLISLIAHRNVVALQDFGVFEHTDNHAVTYMAMELLSGYSVAEALELGPLDPVTAFQITLQACEGMAAAHERGVIHRDLKPDNIFVQTRDQFGNEMDAIVKILDLGIGKLLSRRLPHGLTLAGTVVGTPAYMSPEQCQGQEADARSDVYAMGIVLYEMLFGRVPFEEESPLMILPRHIGDTPTWDTVVAADRGIPDDTREVVLRALAKEPDDRHPSMLALQKDVSMLHSRIRHQENYALPTQLSVAFHPTLAPRATIPAGRSSLRAAKLSTTWRDPVEIAPDIHWIGRHHSGQLECNSYLCRFRSSSRNINLLVDPGPPRDLDAIETHISSLIGSITALNYIFLSQVSPDAAGNAAHIQRRNPTVHIICAEDIWRLAQHYGLDPSRHIPTRIISGLKMNLDTGHSLQFIPVPFCPDRGATLLYIPERAVLFSGDLFGGTSTGPGLMFTRDSLQGIKTFHQIYMPSPSAIKEAIRRMESLVPRPHIIAPQHGTVITHDQIPAVLDELRRTPVGHGLITTCRDNTDAISLANDILNVLAHIAGDNVLHRLYTHLGEAPHLIALFDLEDPCNIEGFRVDPAIAIHTLMTEVARVTPDAMTASLRVAMIPIRRRLADLSG